MWALPVMREPINPKGWPIEMDPPLGLSFSSGMSSTRWQWSSWKHAIARIWKITESYGYAPLELRLSWFKRKSARTALNQLLDTDPKQVVMAHGAWQRENGRAYLEKAFAWLSFPRRRDPSCGEPIT